MAKIYRERSLLEFQKAFATEEACAQHLKEVRWPDGFVCPRCGHGVAWFIRTRKILDCKDCRAQTSLTAGTIFHKTRTPLLKWYCTNLQVWWRWTSRFSDRRGRKEAAEAKGRSLFCVPFLFIGIRRAGRGQGLPICGWWKMRLLHPLRVFWKGSAVGQEHLKEGRCWRQSGPTDGDPMGGLRKIRV